MPILQALYLLFISFFAEGLVKILLKVAAILGIGAISYGVSNYVLTSIINDVYVEFAAMDSVLLALSIKLGVTEMINYLISYLSILVSKAIYDKATE